MSPFTELELAALRAKFGTMRTDGGFPRDVDRLALQCSEKHTTAKFNNPFAMLTRWLEVAEQNDTDRISFDFDPPTTAVQSHPNSFVTDWGTPAEPSVAARELQKIFAMLDGAPPPE